MENLTSTEVMSYVRDATFSQIAKTLTGTDGSKNWRGSGPLVGRYRHHVMAVTAGTSTTGGGGTTVRRVRYGIFS